MTSLRLVLFAAALAATVAALVLPRPGVYGPLALCGLVLFIVGAGSVAADAIPWRPLPLACSAATMPLGAALVARAPVPAAVAAAAALLQALPWLVRRQTAVAD